MRTSTDWVIVGLFFAGFFAVTAAEVVWLVRAASVPLRKAFGLAALSNFVCITLGFTISFGIFAIMIAMAFDGSLENIAGGESTAWSAVTVALIAPFAILVFAKWAMVKLFRLSSVASPFGYAVLWSLLFFLSVAAPPALFVFIRSS